MTSRTATIIVLFIVALFTLAPVDTTGDMKDMLGSLIIPSCAGMVTLAGLGLRGKIKNRIKGKNKRRVLMGLAHLGGTIGLGYLASRVGATEALPSAWDIAWQGAGWSTLFQFSYDKTREIKAENGTQ